MTRRKTTARMSIGGKMPRKVAKPIMPIEKPKEVEKPIEKPETTWFDFIDHRELDIKVLLSKHANPNLDWGSEKSVTMHITVHNEMHDMSINKAFAMQFIGMGCDVNQVREDGMTATKLAEKLQPNSCLHRYLVSLGGK
jgi:hypothetical protein